MIPAWIALPLIVATTFAVYAIVLRRARRLELSPKGWSWLLAGTGFAAGAAFFWMITVIIETVR